VLAAPGVEALLPAVGHVQRVRACASHRYVPDGPRGSDAIGSAALRRLPEEGRM
jgi:hypothetical protein